MKNLIVFFLIVSLFAFLYFQSPSLSFDEACSACFVVEKEVEGFDQIKNGNDFLVQVYEDFENFYNSYNEIIKGFNLYFTSLEIDQFAKKVNGQIYQSQSVENIDIYYGYTSMFKDFRYLQGRKVNIQIAVKENEVIVGFPLILTGF